MHQAVRVQGSSYLMPSQLNISFRSQADVLEAIQPWTTAHTPTSPHPETTFWEPARQDV